ncbi:MAG TPA: GNAT family N-acetyltransferase [Candidatus Tumulicola sp.]|jgi:ribosomal protein S18 acetylase RimI-like enzyme
MRIELRAATEEDRAFVEELYFSTQRWIIEKLFGWRGDAVEKAKFASFYDQRNTQIILDEDRAMGWWTVVRDDDFVELGQICLTPEHQRRGIGTLLISQLIEEAKEQRKTASVSTAKINPALSLYKRLGFVPVSETDFKIYLERR